MTVTVCVLVVDRVIVMVGNQGGLGDSVKVESGCEELAACVRGITLGDSMFDWDGRRVSDQRALIVASSRGKVVVRDVET